MAKLPTYSDHLQAVAWRNKVPVRMAKTLTPVTVDQWPRKRLSVQMKRWAQERKIARSQGLHVPGGRRSNKSKREALGPMQQGILGMGNG